MDVFRVYPEQQPCINFRQNCQRNARFAICLLFRLQLEEPREDLGFSWNSLSKSAVQIAQLSDAAPTTTVKEFKSRRSLDFDWDDAPCCWSALFETIFCFIAWAQHDNQKLLKHFIFFKYIFTALHLTMIRGKVISGPNMRHFQPVCLASIAASVCLFTETASFQPGQTRLTAPAGHLDFEFFQFPIWAFQF